MVNDDMTRMRTWKWKQWQLQCPRQRLGARADAAAAVQGSGVQGFRSRV